MELNEEMRNLIRDYLKDVNYYLPKDDSKEKREILQQIESHVHESLESRTQDKTPQLSDLDAVLAQMSPPQSYGDKINSDTLKDFSRRRSLKIPLATSIASIVLAGLILILTHGQIKTDIPFLIVLIGQIIAIACYAFSKKTSLCNICCEDDRE